MSTYRVCQGVFAKTVVLFGGDNEGGACCRIYYNETWTWDGVTWTQQFPTVGVEWKNVEAGKFGQPAQRARSRTAWYLACLPAI